jgi:hypothetical protein
MLYPLLIAALVSLQPGVIADMPPASASPAATTAPVEDPKVTALAKGEFTALQHGKIDRSHYTEKTSAALTDALVAQTAAQLAQLGDLKSITLDASQQVQGDMAYAYTLVCANGSLKMTLALTKDGLIDGIYFRPA